MRKTVNCESLTLSKEAIAPQHTPGPWSYTSRGDIVGGGATLATVGAASAYISKAEDLANTHLIAAAPELLAALEAILAPFNYGDKIELHNTDDQYHAARAAIAKAKGV